MFRSISAKILQTFSRFSKPSVASKTNRNNQITYVWTNGNWSKRKHNFLFGLITFPWTVHALSWKKDKSTDESLNPSESFQDPNSVEAKICDKNDKELLQDLKLADSIYKSDDIDSGPKPTHQEIYTKLCKHRKKDEAELFWRLSRVVFELSKLENSSQKRKLEMVQEAYEYAEMAVELDETNFGGHKWMAILLNEYSSMRGIKEQIKESYNVKKHMDKAAELNPKDATSIYLIGNWCFTVASIPWFQRKIAETIFAVPPTCSFDQAIQHFLEAENVQPLFYSMNLLMLAKSYMKLEQNSKAEEVLYKLKKTPCVTNEDQLAHKEGDELLRTIQKNKKPYAH